MMSGDARDGQRRGDGWTARTTPVVPPVYHAVTYHLDASAYEDIQTNGGLTETWYGRFGNPTVAAAAEVIRDMENAPAAVLASSGMAAIATTLLTLCRAGDRIVASSQLYGDTHDLLTRDLPGLGIQVDRVDPTNLEQWAEAVDAGPVSVLYGESLSNPQLGVLDIRAVAELAQRSGARLVIDNTFCSPYLLRPFDFGADLVVESVTKYLNGHSDVIAGSVSGESVTIEDIRRRLVTFGGSLDPHAAYLVWRGLQTFELRLRRQHASASTIARFLERRSDVRKVIYPGLPTHPQSQTIHRQFREGSGGGMVTFVVDGGDERALRVMKALRTVIEATSLGGVESLISAPFNSSHFSLTAEERASIGIDPGMLRLSIGVEDPGQLIGDLQQALDAD